MKKFEIPQANTVQKIIFVKAWIQSVVQLIYFYTLWNELVQEAACHYILNLPNAG